MTCPTREVHNLSQDIARINSDYTRVASIQGNHLSTLLPKQTSTWRVRVARLGANTFATNLALRSTEIECVY